MGKAWPIYVRRRGWPLPGSIRGVFLQPGHQRIGLLLLGGPEGDLDVAGHSRHWMCGVVPGRGRDARKITQEFRGVGHAVDHVVIDVEHLPAGVVRIPGWESPMCALVMSTSAWPAPAEPPPPRKWEQPVSCASPVIDPSANRSNSTQPQKPPSSSPQKDGLLQLPEIPTCHVSWRAPPP